MDSEVLLLDAIVFLILVSFNNGYLDDALSEISSQGNSQYCDGEQFWARCGTDEVIIINGAFYKDVPGRCLPEGADSGCVVSVTEHLDAVCSGRRSCTIGLPSTTMDSALTSTCAKDKATALYASYRCVKVIGVSSCQACRAKGKVKLTASHGYLSSVITRETEANEGCGSSRCPWLIQVSPGQTINLTLFDFTVVHQPQIPNPLKQQQQRPGVPLSTTDRCPRLLIIKERANPKDSPICGGQSKQRQLYMSVSHFLEVHFVSENIDLNRGQFLVYYEAVGCPDIVPPKYSRMKRMHNQCEIDCPDTPGVKWILNCINNQWDGEVGKCPVPSFLTAGKTETVSNRSAGIWSILSSLPLNVLITLVVAVTVIFGVIIITTGIVCLKKSRYRCHHRPDSVIYTGACSEFEFRQDLVNANSALVPKTNVPGTMLVASTSSKARRPSADPLMPVRDNTYAADRCMESRPLPAIPDATPHSSVQRDHINRVVVQVHPNNLSGSDSAATNQARPTVVCRGVPPVADRRPPPHARSHEVGRAPAEPLLAEGQGDSHHYFILDPDVLVEEPATLRSGQSLNYQSGESETVPVPYQKAPEAGGGGRSRVAVGSCNSSDSGMQLRPIRDMSGGQQKRQNQPQNVNDSGIGSWP